MMIMTNSPASKAIRVIKAAKAPAQLGIEPIRLNKRMADLGLCSRREADEWIERGWVKVNGELAPMGLKVLPQDRVEVDKRAASQQANQVTILLNKPIGYVSGQAEDGHEPAVVLISSRTHWMADSSHLRFKAEHARGLAPAGRLDIDSTGLLVLTQDGRIARQLIGEDSGVEKEYLVRVSLGKDKNATAQNVQALFPLAKLNLLRHGLSLDGEPLKRAQVDWQNPEQLRFVLTEGKKRQIRRMCEAVGLHVTALKRVRIGSVRLGQLPLGQWRYLSGEERF
jgi:23S rRNA pseudouridine2604 synthase